MDNVLLPTLDQVVSHQVVEILFITQHGRTEIIEIKETLQVFEIVCRFDLLHCGRAVPLSFLASFSSRSGRREPSMQVHTWVSLSATFASLDHFASQPPRMFNSKGQWMLNQLSSPRQPDYAPKQYQRSRETIWAESTLLVHPDECLDGHPISHLVSEASPEYLYPSGQTGSQKIPTHLDTDDEDQSFGSTPQTSADPVH